jgi:hypothetical protein
MHSARLADPLDELKIDIDRLTKKRDKTIADHQQIAKMEWYGGLWLLDDKPCILCEAIESPRRGVAGCGPVRHGTARRGKARAP